MRIEQAEREPVHALVKMKRDERHVGRHALGQLHQHHAVAALRGETRVAAVFDAEARGRVRIHFHVRRRAKLVEVADLAGARARVEMLHHPAAVEPERVLRVRAFVVVHERQRDEPGLAVRVLELAVGVETRRAGHISIGARPLDAALPFDLLVSHAGVIQHAAPGEFAQLLKHALGGFREF